MDNTALIQWCLEEAKEKAYITIPEDTFSSLSKDEAKEVADRLQHKVLIKLPEREIRFFEWLKEIDRKVWDDLWTNQETEVYVVSSLFLPMLVGRDGRGFPICDLVNVDNYYFTPNHMVDEESKVYIETSQKRFQAKKSLTVPQLLALEISLGSIDVWHFAYRHKLDIDEAKQAVKDLSEEFALVHLTDAEHLAPFVEF